MEGSYKFYFIRDNDPVLRYIGVIADDYTMAVEKIKAMGIPGFKISEWSVKGVMEDPEDYMFELDE